VESNAGAKSPGTGDLFPSFTLPDDEGRVVQLAELLARGPVVVSLNRGHWCSYCRIELESLQGIHDEIRRRGASIVAITPDRQPYARKLKERSKLAFPVLSDMDNAFAMSLGLVVWVGEEIRALYENDNLNLAKSQGNDGWMIPIPATYVIAPDGRISASFVEPDFRKRMPPEQILEAIPE
jgi:peroxiredoxin